jgi:hypothetical protein
VSRSEATAFRLLNGRRSKSSILAELSLADRTTVINQLWNGKVRREQDSASSVKPSNLILPPHASSESSISPTSIFALSRSGSSTPFDSTSPTSTISSNSSADSALRRFGRRFAASSRRKLEAVGFMTPRQPQEAEDVNSRDRATPDPFLRMESNGRTHSRETSQTRSGGSNNSSGSSSIGHGGVLRRAHSAHPMLNTTQLSPTSHHHHHHHHHLPTAATLPMATSSSAMSALLPNGPQSGAPSLHAASAPPILPTSAQTFQGRPPQTPLLRAARSGTWFAGPTRAAKEGIVREWGALNEAHAPASATSFPAGGDDGEGGDARELGRRLLYAQLAAMAPAWIVADGLEDEEEAATEMLVERWVRPGSVRRRMAQWEEIMAPAAAAAREGRHRAIGEEEVINRFYFGR